MDEDVANARWYHTIELPDGVVTPGEYDLRKTVGHVRFPPSLHGRRCLDVGTRDGFWAFEMERRGASEVVAIDLDDHGRLDWPLPARSLDTATLVSLDASAKAFGIAHRALGSNVQRMDLSVYDLKPKLVGEFDFVFMGTLLHHLRDPIGALAAIREVTRGELLLNATVSLGLSLSRPRTPLAELMTVSDPFWWVPNRAGLRRMAAMAGFEVVASGGPFVERYGKGAGWRARARSVRDLPRVLLLRIGVVHIWLLLRPRP